MLKFLKLLQLKKRGRWNWWKKCFSFKGHPTPNTSSIYIQGSILASTPACYTKNVMLIFFSIRTRGASGVQSAFLRDSKSSSSSSWFRRLPSKSWWARWYWSSSSTTSRAASGRPRDSALSPISDQLRWSPRNSVNCCRRWKQWCVYLKLSKPGVKNKQISS